MFLSKKIGNFFYLADIFPILSALNCTSEKSLNTILQIKVEHKPIKYKRWTKKNPGQSFILSTHSKTWTVQQNAESSSAVSLTIMRSQAQQCHWPCGVKLSGVIDHAESTMFPKNFQRFLIWSKEAASWHFLSCFLMIQTYKGSRLWLMKIYKLAILDFLHIFQPPRCPC